MTAAVAVEGRVHLALYDVRGRRVAVVHDGRLPAGRHEFSWSATDERGRPFPSGVYFARFDAPDRSDVRKLLLVH